MPNIDRTHPSLGHLYRAHLFLAHPPAPPPPPPSTPSTFTCRPHSFLPPKWCGTNAAGDGTTTASPRYRSIWSHPRNGRPRRFNVGDALPVLRPRARSCALCHSDYRRSTTTHVLALLGHETRPFDGGKIKKNRIEFPGVGRPFHVAHIQLTLGIHIHIYIYILLFASVEPRCAWPK